jgi:hypothetical protein
MTEGYEEQRVPVGPATKVTFIGKLVAEIPAPYEQQSGVDSALYETPEGLKLHLFAWEAHWATDTRPLGKESQEKTWVGGGLFPEEEARQRHPDLLADVLRQKRP